MSHGNQNNQGRNNQQPAQKPQTQPQIGLNIIAKEPEKKQSKIVILKVDTYDFDSEAKLLTEQENKGFIHYIAMPFPYGTGRLHYFRSI